MATRESPANSRYAGAHRSAQAKGSLGSAHRRTSIGCPDAKALRMKSQAAWSSHNYDDIGTTRALRCPSSLAKICWTASAVAQSLKPECLEQACNNRLAVFAPRASGSAGAPGYCTSTSYSIGASSVARCSSAINRSARVLETSAKLGTTT